MVRQPYSEAVLSTGGRLHPRFLRKRGLGRKWSSLWQRETEGFEKNNYFIENKILFPLRIPRNPRYPRNAPTLLCITSSVSQSPLQKANCETSIIPDKQIPDKRIFLVLKPSPPSSNPIGTKSAIFITSIPITIATESTRKEMSTYSTGIRGFSHS